MNDFSETNAMKAVFKEQAYKKAQCDAPHSSVLDKKKSENFPKV